MKTLVQLPVGTTLGLMAGASPALLQRYIELARAGVASAVHELHTLSVAQVGSKARGNIPENDYMPFTIAKCDGKGGWKST